jgi:predicted NAD/FAD-binding protein
MKRRSAAILHAIDHPNRHDARAAWRLAVQIWLQRHNLVTIHTNQTTNIKPQVLPHFYLTLHS